MPLLEWPPRPVYLPILKGVYMKSILFTLAFVSQASSATTLRIGTYHDIDAHHCNFKVSTDFKSGHLFLQAVAALPGKSFAAACKAKYEFAPNESAADFMQQVNTDPETRAQSPYIAGILRIFDNSTFFVAESKNENDGSVSLSHVTAFSFGAQPMTKTLEALKKTVAACNQYSSGAPVDQTALAHELDLRYKALNKSNCDALATASAATIHLYDSYFSKLKRARAVSTRAASNSDSMINSYESCVLTQASDFLLSRGMIVDSGLCSKVAP
jgi:hypothetical protein